MRIKRTDPCRECPFRRKALPGWTGDATPTEHLVITESSDGATPCHLNVNYRDPEWRTKLDGVAYCAGAAQYMNNKMQRPRDPELADVIASFGRNREVFSWPEEYLARHLRRPVSRIEAIDLRRDANHALHGRNDPATDDRTDDPARTDEE